MQILYVTPEVAPYCGSSDLAEISGALPRALHELGMKVTVVAPFYKDVQPDRYGLARRIRKLTVPVGGSSVEVGLVEGKLRNCDVGLLLIDHPESFQRDGYYGEGGTPYRDNHRRFYLLARAAIEAAHELSLHVDVVHANGTACGFLPLLLQLGTIPALAGVSTVFTIENAADVQLFDPAILDELRIGYELYNPDGIEFHGRVNLLKAGVLYSDRVTTFSRAYARELQTEELGGGLHGLFRAQSAKLTGLVPGLDPAVWDPMTDHRLAERYDPDTLEGKEACKRALQAELELPVRPQVPLLAMLGPLDEAHGADLLLRALPALLPLKPQVVILGQPAAGLGGALADAAAASPQSIAYRPELGADALRRALAGADALLCPYRQDPGGTLPLKALRYGAVPVGRCVGGLRDVVVDADPESGTGNGICFAAAQPEALEVAVHRMLAAHGNRRAWLAMQRSGMRASYTWGEMARRLSEVYQRAME